MNQKEKINYLILEYEKNNYETDIFCDQFVTILYYEKDGSIPEDLFVLLDKYAVIFSRFSPYKEDIKSGVLFDEIRIKHEFKKLFTIWCGNVN